MSVDRAALQLPTVFVSYTDIDRRGKRFASKLREVLIQSGYDVFIFDHSKKQHYGGNMWTVLTNEIRKRHVVIIVCTEAISASYGVEFEINQALSNMKLIIPLRFDNAKVPETISIKIRDTFQESNSNRVFKSVAKWLPQAYQDHAQLHSLREEEIEKFSRVEPPKDGFRLLHSILDAYFRDSVVELASTVENFDVSKHSALNFGHMGRRVAITRSWIGDPSHYIMVDDLGRSVAWAERSHLLDLWGKLIRTEVFPMSKFTLDEFQEILDELSSGMNPKVLFAPINMFVKFTSMIMRAAASMNALRWRPGEFFFVLKDGAQLKIVWSNKYAPSDCFVLVDPSATLWCVKPDPITGKRLRTYFVQNQKESTKIDFLIKTVMGTQVMNSDKIRQFRFE